MERTGHPPSYTEAKKTEVANTNTHGCLSQPLRLASGTCLLFASSGCTSLCTIQQVWEWDEWQKESNANYNQLREHSRDVTERDDSMVANGYSGHTAQGQVDRQTYTNRHTEIDRQRQTYIDRHTEIDIHRQTYRDRHTETYIHRQTYWDRHTETGIHVYRQVYRDRHTETDIQRQTYRDKHTYTDIQKQIDIQRVRDRHSGFQQDRATNTDIRHNQVQTNTNWHKQTWTRLTDWKTDRHG